MVRGARHVVFTLNNWTRADEEMLMKYAEDCEDLNYIVYGREIGEKGTPHLQGYIQWGKQMRFAKLAKLWKAAIFAAKGQGKDCMNYCKKGEQPKKEWEEFKEQGALWGKNADFTEFGICDETRGQVGKRNDLTNMIERVEEGARYGEIFEEFPSMIARYKPFVLETIGRKRVRDYEGPEVELYDWQKWLMNRFEKPREHRTVYWIWSDASCTGKTIFGQLLAAKFKHDFLAVKGRLIDMLYMYSDQKIIHWNLPRERNAEDDEMKGIIANLETLCDGGPIPSTKYESCVKIVEAHVIVTSNMRPPVSKMPLRFIEVHVDTDNMYGPPGWQDWRDPHSVRSQDWTYALAEDEE